MIKKKRNKLKCLIILAVVLFSIGHVLGLQCIVDDLTFYPVPDMPRPEKGVTYEDPVFHTNITRITDSPTDVPGNNYDYAQPGYYKHNIENADGTMLVIQSAKQPLWHIWNANPPYNKIKDVPSAILNWKDADCRWDNSDPNLIYCHNGPSLFQWNVQTEEITELHNFANDFPGETITSILLGEEGDASDDRRYWAFVTQSEGSGYNHTHLLVYDKQTDTIVSHIDRGEGTFGPLGGKDYFFNEGVWIRPRDSGIVMNYNWVGMSPSGEYVVTGSPPSWIYPRDLSTTRVFSTHGHVEVGIAKDGKEVMVDAGQNYASPDVNGDIGWLRMSYLDTGEQYWLAPVGVGGMYPSCNNHLKPGWCSYVNYAPNYPDEPTTWAEASIMMVELSKDHYPNPSMANHARIWRIAHTHQKYLSYGDKPFAKTNLRGTKVFFGSGWGTSMQDEPSDEAQYDVYQIDLPEGCFDYIPDHTCSDSETGYCSDGKDNDCDNLVDCNDPDCIDDAACADCSEQGESCSSQSCCSGLYCDASNVCQTCLSSETGHCSGNIDEDCDGSADCLDPDCSSDTDCCKDVGENCVPGQCCPGMVCETVSGDFPVAIASADVLSGPVPLTVQFTGSGTDSDGTIAGYRWSFANGYGYSQEQNPVKVFRDPGNYKVVLTVTDNEGLKGSASLDITVTEASSSNQWPTVQASADKTTITAGESIRFSSSAQDSDGSISYVYWYFGDGGATSSANPPNVFENPGDYIVTLIAKDDGGAIVSDTVDITVTGGSDVCVQGSICSSGADLDSSDSISIDEVVSFIDGWKTGTISIDNVIDAIGEWKSGC